MGQPNANGAPPLDTTIRIVTPENIAFDYRLAGPFRRFPAYLIDVLLQGALTLVGLLGLTLIAGYAGFGLFMVLHFFIEWGYGGLFETFWNGQTPGKSILRIRVVGTDGGPITFSQAMLRNVLRVVDRLTYGASAMLSFLLTTRMQRLGDLAADTMVVVEEPATVRVAREAQGAAIEAAVRQIPLGFEADAALADAISSYMARRSALPPARRREVASHLVLPLARRLGVPPTLDPDAVICALYRKVIA